ncbi:MAG: hypothetical protein LBE28_08375 [Providencia alcalifaciens]|jgi:hypothetical protein|uniref:hypothetical protein n=1 Tax=Providencia TaxID=586 RepID=UPI0018C51866|nr:hypothetical protein [Providencia alcalifaciens]MBG5884081.1 hypothetical protein [Providencia alcalifaciens]MDR2242768.1 hypothetical protein [Providencia alcalifaciens]MDR2990240.1 hypothetical protein [Providencia alcalifaciens]
MSLIEHSSVKNNNNISLEKLMNYDIQQNPGFKNALNAKIGCFILSIKNNLDSISEMVFRKKIIRSYHSVIEAIEFKSANNDISGKSLRKIERKVIEINKKYSFLDSVDIKQAIISKTREANKPVRDKISDMLDRKFGINIYYNKEHPSAEMNLAENKRYILSKNIDILPSIEEVDEEEGNENNAFIFEGERNGITKDLSNLHENYSDKINELYFHDRFIVMKSLIK